MGAFPHLRQTGAMPPTLRILQADDASRYRAVRLRALTDDADAFVTSAQEYA